MDALRHRGRGRWYRSHSTSCSPRARSTASSTTPRSRARTASARLASRRSWPHFDFHARTCLQTMQAVAPGMKERRWGRIVNILTTTLTGYTERTAYRAGKEAVKSLTVSAALELARVRHHSQRCGAGSDRDGDLLRRESARKPRRARTGSASCRCSASARRTRSRPRVEFFSARVRLHHGPGPVRRRWHERGHGDRGVRPQGRRQSAATKLARERCPPTASVCSDLSPPYAGAMAGALLADLGADVIAVEHPAKGSPMRTMLPQKDGHSLWWKVIARGKRGITIDLSTSDGQELRQEAGAGRRCRDRKLPTRNA